MSLTMTSDGVDEVIADAVAIGNRATRTAIIPLMKAAWQPVVALEKAGIHDISGALGGSLAARSGKGDYTQRFSVYTPATATVKQVVRRWSKSPRRQHHKFAARALVSGLKRYGVFYGRWVEYGHRIGRGKTPDEIVGQNSASAHFAERAYDAGADTALDTAQEAVLDYILGTN